MGQFDLIAETDLVRQMTGYEKMHYIGYDQGGTQMLYEMSWSNDLLRDRIEAFSALAPCTSMRNTKNQFIVKMSKFYDDLKEVDRIYGMFRSDKWDKKLESGCKKYK